ncbi:hypothetical protein ACHWQZ_G013062 [Mnemiopsis leidyi]
MRIFNFELKEKVDHHLSAEFYGDPDADSFKSHNVLICLMTVTTTTFFRSGKEKQLSKCLSASPARQSECDPTTTTRFSSRCKHSLASPADAKDDLRSECRLFKGLLLQQFDGLLEDESLFFADRVCKHCCTEDEASLELLLELPLSEPIIEDEKHVLLTCPL